MLFAIYKYSKSFPRLINSTSRLLSTSNTMSAKVAVVLSGSGVYDGSEIHEASMCLTHLSRAGATVSMFAPDKPQMHVINHLDGSEIKPDRNCLVESARIARGKIQPLSELKSNDHDAVILPGGFGAAKNLCDWAVKNVECVVDSDVDRVLKSFNKDKKPIGLTCIAPVLAAKCIPAVTLTVGSTTEQGGKWPYAGTASAIESCGAKHVEKDVTEAYVDTVNNVVTTPAFMCEAPLHEIYDGIGEFVTKVIGLIKS